MNTGSLGLNAYEVATIVSTVEALVSDPDTGTEVVFYTSGGGAYDPRSGSVSYNETPTTLTGWLSPVTLEQIPMIEGAQIGDVQLLVLASDLATEPTTGDRFRAGDIDYRIHRATRGPLETHHVIHAQRVQ